MPKAKPKKGAKPAPKKTSRKGARKPKAAKES